MLPEEFEASDAWLANLLAPYRVEIDRRALVVRTEFDPRFQMRRDAGLEIALKRLIRFVFSTLPEGCEAYLASARSTAAVAPLGAGTITCRWQVAGRDQAPTRPGTVAIRPLVGGGAFHRESRTGHGLVRDFADAGWELRLEATEDDLEMWAWAATT
jgi:hypothetical protein